MASPSKTTHVDEDVEDLDDVLEQFSSPPKSSAPAESPGRSVLPSSSQQVPNPPEKDAFTDAFAAEFAKGMESLLKELGDGTFKPEQFGDLTTGEEEQEKLFKDAWSKIMGEAEPSTSTSTSTAPASDKSSREGLEGSFQDRIKKTMDKMKEGQSSLKSSDGGDPDLEDLLSSLGDSGDGGGTEEGLQGILETMMSQLMSKEVLYDPLKEMHEKFPSYLVANEHKLPPTDKDRYQKQQKTVSQIVAIFEARDYSEDDPETGLKVMSLMNEMQEHGAPPTEIMGELPPGMSLGPDGLPQLPGDCRTM